MRLRWPAFIVCFSALCALVSDSTDTKRSYDHQAAPGFLFEQRPFVFSCADRPRQYPPGTHHFGVFVSPNQPQYARTRLETLNLPLSEVPALTIAAEPSPSIQIAGVNRDVWAVQFCAMGLGNSDTEARKRLDQATMSRTGSLLTFSGGGGNLFAQVPENAPLTVHTFGAVEARNMSGPLRISATGGRATILNTTGRVDAEGKIVDFAGARGQVMLNSYTEIDIKLTGPRFLGGLSAYAQREVRVIVPRGFQSPIEVMVSRPKDLICRADICSSMKRESGGPSYTFKSAGSGDAASDHVWFRSDQSTVVIDNWK